MKTTLLVTLIFGACFSFGQSEKPIHLDSSEVASRFTNKVLLELKINFSIYKVFEFKDDLGTHELVMTEHSISEKENDSIRAYCFLVKNHKRKLEWQLKDFIVNEKDATSEKSIWFWTRYLRLDDVDKNGIIDPVVVYGTADKNGIGDGRLKLLYYINGKKYAIRHVNSSMDWGRNTQVDQSYYALPLVFKTYMETLMHYIYDNGHAIFPAGWEENMKQKKLNFDEN